MHGFMKGTTGVVRNWLLDLRPKAMGDNVVEVANGGAVFQPEQCFYHNEGYEFFEMPDGATMIVVRMDRKAQKARLALLHFSGLRGLWQRLVRWWRKRRRVWVEVPIAEVLCQDGLVIDVRDTREFSAYHASGGGPW